LLFFRKVACSPKNAPSFSVGLVIKKKGVVNGQESIQDGTDISKHV